MKHEALPPHGPARYFVACVRCEWFSKKTFSYPVQVGPAALRHWKSKYHDQQKTTGMIVSDSMGGIINIVPVTEEFAYRRMSRDTSGTMLMKT
jgi:hypothetical protein